jgi:hypothetical protein
MAARQGTATTQRAATRAGARNVDDSRETVSLIGSDKVEGTAVYGPDDNKIGAVQRVMIDKISGKIAYAVVSFGGFLGMGEEYYPMSWSKLDYDTDLGGYRVDITEEQLRSAPNFSRSTDWDWSNRTNDERVYKHYNEPLWY